MHATEALQTDKRLQPPRQATEARVHHAAKQIQFTAENSA